MGGHDAQGIRRAEMTMKSIIVFVAVVGGVFSPVIVSHLLWRFEPVLHLNLKVVDYSVPDETYRNHTGLFWLLNYLRIQAPAVGGPWLVNRDYIGFDPAGKGRGITLSQTSLAQTDWIYLADTYGVHITDRRARPGQQVTNGFIFGGLTLSDAATLTAFTDRGGSIISEFNSLADPTPQEARRILSTILGVRQTGWVGRFVSDISTLPRQHAWFTDLYRRAFGKRPIPAGPGMMLLHEDGRLVLLSGAPFEQSMPTLALTEEGREWMTTPVGTPPYYGWFGICAPDDGTEVLAELLLPKLNGWKKSLSESGVPLRFPAVTRKQTGSSIRYALAADISVLEEVPNFYGLAFLPRMLAAVNRRRDSRRNEPTFWQFFVPVVGKMLTDAANDSRAEGGESNDD